MKLNILFLAAALGGFAATSHAQEISDQAPASESMATIRAPSAAEAMKAFSWNPMKKNFATGIESITDLGLSESQKILVKVPSTTVVPGTYVVRVVCTANVYPHLITEKHTVTVKVEADNDYLLICSRKSRAPSVTVMHRQPISPTQATN